MRKASNVIPVIESLVSQMTPVVTISLIEVDGVNWKVHSCDTYWTMRDMTVTIGGVDFTVLSVVQDSYIIVSGLAIPVGSSYQLPAPQFWHGSHRKVNSEMSEESDAGQAVVYLPVPRVKEMNDPEEEVVYIASIRPIFLYTYDPRRDTIELQQDEVIEPLNAMADFFLWLIEDNDGSYNTPADVDRREWMNFGDETVWGKDKLIFNRNYSGVELQFDLEVLPDGVCACDEVSPIVCAPVPFYLNGTFEEDLTSGEDFLLTVVDTNNLEVGTYNDLTNTVTVPAAGGGGGTASQTFNGAAVTDQDSGTTKVITVKDTAGTNVGTKVTDTALALGITIADAEIQINTVPVDQVEAEGVKNIDVVDSTSAPIGNWNGTAWEIDNSTINVNGAQIASTPPESVVNLNVHDSAGNDIGTINGLTVEIDDVTVDNSDVSYTVDIPAEGVFVLPDVTVTINGASQGSFPSVKDLSITASNIIYIRPANSGYGTTSYLTGDEGYNETNYPAPTSPAFGVPAYLDPTNPKMLLNNNVFGHKHRFTGVNGGYYDYNTAQYKLANGTVSDQATVFGTTASNTSYLIDNHTGLGWKWNIQGVGTWSAKVSEGLGLTHASFSDWFLPSRYQYRSLYCIFNLGTNLISLVPFNSINSCKTSTPTFGSETTAHHQINGAATTLSRADSINDAAYFCRWHF